MIFNKFLLGLPPTKVNIDSENSRNVNSRDDQILYTLNYYQTLYIFFMILQYDEEMCANLAVLWASDTLQETYPGLRSKMHSQQKNFLQAL